MQKSFLYSLQVIYFTFINELKRIFTDSGAILILLGAAIIYPVVYSVAYKNNVLENIPIGLVDLDQSSSSLQVAKNIEASEKISFYANYVSMEAAQADFWEGKINGVVFIDDGFEIDIFKGEQASIGLYSDAGYLLYYKETLTGVLQSAMNFAAKIEVKKLISKGSSMDKAMNQVQPLKAEFIQLYNPSSSYGTYLMPGMLVIILQQLLLIGIGMVNGADNERRNNLKIQPGMLRRRGVFSVITGKALAYFLLSIFTFTFSFVWIYKWFGYPAKASFYDQLALFIPFILATIFLGLAISILYRKREHSIMLLVFLSPIALFLSGVSWPARFFPEPINIIAQLFPSTNMATAYLRLQTMGASLTQVRGELFFLMGQMVIYYFLAAGAYKLVIKRQIKNVSKGVKA